MQAVSIPTIYGWIKRWQQAGLEGLVTKPRSGRPAKTDTAYCLALEGVLEQEPSALRVLLQGLGYKAARSIISRMQDTTKGIDNVYLLATRTLGGLNLAQAKAQSYVDTAIVNGGTFILYAH